MNNTFYYSKAHTIDNEQEQNSGMNLINNTHKDDKDSAYGANSTNYSASNVGISGIVKTIPNGILNVIDKITLHDNYTLSTLVHKSANPSIFSNAPLLVTLTGAKLSEANNEVTYMTMLDNTKGVDEFTKISFTFNTKPLTTPISISIQTLDGKSFDITDLKLEYGYIATGWNLSLKDIKSLTPSNVESADRLSTKRVISLTGDVSGSIEFDGSSNQSMVTTITNKPKSVNATLLAASWDATAKIQTVTVNGVTDSNTVMMSLASTATDDQVKAAGESTIMCTTQSANSITVKCINKIPIIDIPITVTILN